jgi:hypothetical protein
MREVAAEEDVRVAPELIDRVVVLDRGLIVPRDREGFAVAQKRTLSNWYLHLTNFLAREANRRSNFDWEEYGRELAGERVHLDGWLPPPQQPKKGAMKKAAPVKASADKVPAKKAVANRTALKRTPAKKSAGSAFPTTLQATGALWPGSARKGRVAPSPQNPRRLPS